MRLAESLAKQLLEVLGEGNWTLEAEGTDAPVVAIGSENDAVLVYVAAPTEKDPDAVRALRVDVYEC